MTPFSTLETEGELLSDEALQAKQKKAEKYANAPERFTLLFVEMEVKADHGNRLVMYSDDGDWSCTCDFFGKHKTCSHVMAVGRVLKPIPIAQPRDNLEDLDSGTLPNDGNDKQKNGEEVHKVSR